MQLTLHLSRSVSSSTIVHHACSVHFALCCTNNTLLDLQRRFPRTCTDTPIIGKLLHIEIWSTLTSLGTLEDCRTQLQEAGNRLTVWRTTSRSIVLYLHQLESCHGAILAASGGMIGRIVEKCEVPRSQLDSRLNFCKHLQEVGQDMGLTGTVGATQ